MKFALPVLLYEIEKTAIATADVKQVITVFYELQENFACYVFVQNGKAVLPILPCVEFYHCYRADFFQRLFADVAESWLMYTWKYVAPCVYVDFILAGITWQGACVIFYPVAK